MQFMSATQNTYIAHAKTFPVNFQRSCVLRFSAIKRICVTAFCFSYCMPTEKTTDQQISYAYKNIFLSKLVSSYLNFISKKTIPLFSKKTDYFPVFQPAFTFIYSVHLKQLFTFSSTDKTKTKKFPHTFTDKKNFFQINIYKVQNAAVVKSFVCCENFIFCTCRHDNGQFLKIYSLRIEDHRIFRPQKRTENERH